jgi:hypothetical protein
MKQLLTLLPVAFCVIGMLVLQNCGPKGDGCEEHAPVNTFYNMKSFDKAKILLTGTDTLVYISTDGDTAVLYGQGKKAFTEKVAKKWDPDPGCSTYDYSYFENIEFTYRGNNPGLNYIFFDFKASLYAPAQTYADITIGNRLYKTYLGVINATTLYDDTVIINSKLYIGKRIYEGYGETNSLPYIYHYQYGLLKITTSKVWLKKI